MEGLSQYYGDPLGRDDHPIPMESVDEKLNNPTTVQEALASPDKLEWEDAMEKEMASLRANEVWDLVEL